jgi:hypothetical protein
MKLLRSCLATCAMCPCIAAAHARVRPESASRCNRRARVAKAGAKDALAKVREADAVAGKTPAEQLMIDRMKVCRQRR